MCEKAGQPMPDGSYDPPLNPLIAPKRLRLQKRKQYTTPLEAVPDLPSDHSGAAETNST
jgi:hypothetical protein